MPRPGGSSLINPWPLLHSLLTRQRLVRDPSPNELLGLLRRLRGITEVSQLDQIRDAIRYCQDQRLVMVNQAAQGTATATTLPSIDPATLAHESVAHLLLSTTQVKSDQPLQEPAPCGGDWCTHGSAIDATMRVLHDKARQQIFEASLTSKSHWQHELLLPPFVAAQHSAIRAHQISLQLCSDVGLTRASLLDRLAYTPKSCDYLLGVALRQCDLPLALNTLFACLHHRHHDEPALPSERGLWFLWKTIASHARIYHQFIHARTLSSSQTPSHSVANDLLTATATSYPPLPNDQKDGAAASHLSGDAKSQPVAYLPTYLLQRCYYLFDIIVHGHCAIQSPDTSASRPTPTPASACSNCSSTPNIPAQSVSLLPPPPRLRTPPTDFLQSLVATADSRAMARILSDMIHDTPFLVLPHLTSSVFHTLNRQHLGQSERLCRHLLDRVVDTSQVHPTKNSLSNPPASSPNGSTSLPLTSEYTAFRKRYPIFPHSITRVIVNTMLAAWLQKRRWDKGHWYLDLLVSGGLGLEVDTWNIILQALFRVHRIPDIHRIWDHIRSNHRATQPSQLNLPFIFSTNVTCPPPNRSTYQILLQGFGVTNRNQDMVEVFHHLLTNTEVTPDRQHYSTLLMYLNRRAERAQVTGIVQQITQGIPVEILLDQYVAPANAPQPQQTHGDERQTVPCPLSREDVPNDHVADAHPTPPLPLLFATTSVYNDLIKRLYSDHEFDLAAKVFDQLNQAWQSEPTTRINQLKTTVDLWPLAASPSAPGVPVGAQPSRNRTDMSLQSVRYPNVVTYNILIRELLKQASLDHALDFLDVLERGAIEPNSESYGLFIQALLASGLLEDAQGMFERMVLDQKRQPSIYVFNLFLEYLLTPTAPTGTPSDGAATATLPTAPRMMQALSIYDQLFAWGVRPNNTTYELLLHAALANRNTWAHLDRLLEDAVHEGMLIRSSTLETIFITSVRAQEYQLAQTVLGYYATLAHRDPSRRVWSAARHHGLLENT
ncbi:hypothetical protein H4R34_001041 [Dimargaris verticillata]|uniref:Pentatricopeptide repeat-containing protein n=1 Tax=Dimargaris verticillata TaxID=2761393 RepID=A0A9W8B4A4_9FUNG|nr:hypothetical protein H4R34_001041 [Dimargaris verticillata]